MPWSAKQLKLFRAAAHNKGISRKTGVKQAAARRMMKEGKKFGEGGSASGVRRLEMTKRSRRYG